MFTWHCEKGRQEAGSPRAVAGGLVRGSWFRGSDPHDLAPVHIWRSSWGLGSLSPGQAATPGVTCFWTSTLFAFPVAGAGGVQRDTACGLPGDLEPRMMALPTAAPLVLCCPIPELPWPCTRGSPCLALPGLLEGPSLVACTLGEQFGGPHSCWGGGGCHIPDILCAQMSGDQAGP